MRHQPVRFSRLREASARRALGHLAALGATLLTVGAADGFAFFEPVQPPRQIRIVAHRGEARQAPENTRPALERCIEDGLEWASLEVRLTRDGQHLVAAGERLRGPSGEEWIVPESTLDQLKTVDIGSAFASRFAGEPPLPLREALRLAKGRLNLSLDCKFVNPDQLVADIRQAGMERQVVVSGALEVLRAVDTAASGELALMARWRPEIALAAWVQTNHLAAVEIDADAVTPDLCQSFRSLGLTVEVRVLGEWDQPAFWDRALACGATRIRTELPEELTAHALWKRLKNRPVRFSLHRGAMRYAPENTLPALAKAIRLGADFVEFDVRSTRDGEFFLLHDATLDDTTDAQGPIADLTGRAVAGLSAGVKFGGPYRSVRLASLDDFLVAAAGRVELYVDAKAISPESLAEALERHQLIDRAVVYQSPDYLARLKAVNPRLRRMPPLESADALPGLVSAVQPYAVDAGWDILSRDLIARCHARDIRVFSDALGGHERVEDYLEAIAWGIDVIQTDHPLRLLRAIERWDGGERGSRPIGGH